MLLRINGPISVNGVGYATGTVIDVDAEVGAKILADKGHWVEELGDARPKTIAKDPDAAGKRVSMIGGRQRPPKPASLTKRGAVREEPAPETSPTTDEVLEAQTDKMGDPGEGG